LRGLKIDSEITQAQREIFIHDIIIRRHNGSGFSKILLPQHLILYTGEPMKVATLNALRQITTLPGTRKAAKRTAL
jgi:hypothetical protein